MIGASREMVSRVMKDLQIGGFIEMRGSSIVLRDTIMLPEYRWRVAGQNPAAAAFPPSSRACCAKRSGWCWSRWRSTCPADLRHLRPRRPRLVPQRHRRAGAQRRRRGRRLGRRPAALPLRRLGLLVGRRFAPTSWSGAIRRLDGARPAPLGFALAGFALLLVASAALEALRLHSLALELPLAPGGVIGDAVGGVRGRRAGLHRRDAAAADPGGGRAAASSPACPGSRCPSASARRSNRRTRPCCGAWERRRDRSLGELAREEREVVVQTEKRREEDHPPLRIEPAVVEIKKSRARAEGKAGAALRGPARHAAAAAQAPRRGQTRRRAGHRRDAGIHLAPDREEALGLRRCR